MMKEMPIMMETRVLMLEEKAALLEDSVAIAQTHSDTLELHVLPHQTSIGTERLVSDVYEFRASPQW